MAGAVDLFHQTVALSTAERLAFPATKLFVFFRVAGQGDFISAPMKNVKADEWVGVIPGDAVQGKSLQYYLEVQITVPIHVPIVGFPLNFNLYAHAEPHHSAKICHEQNKEIASLIQQYQELRDRRRQLRAGVFDADLDSDKGKLHGVLYKLGEELGHPPYTKEKILKCLGEPEFVGICKSFHFR